jgi:hypothetical protein
MQRLKETTNAASQDSEDICQSAPEKSRRNLKLICFSGNAPVRRRPASKEAASAQMVAVMFNEKIAESGAGRYLEWSERPFRPKSVKKSACA